MSEQREPRTIERSAELRGARITDSDLGGASVRGSDLREVTIRESYLDGLRIVGCVLGEVHVSSFEGAPAKVVVEGVDVWQFVSDTLDQRHPERARLRAVSSADDHRAMWQLLERLWGDLLTEAERLPDDVRRTRVGGEWSLTETLRHLVFAIDTWLGKMLRGDDRPFHPLGLPPTDFPSDQLGSLGLDADADPSWAEVRAALADRHAAVSHDLQVLRAEELPELRSAVIVPGVWEDQTETVTECFRILENEHVEHLRYARRDLATLIG